MTKKMVLKKLVEVKGEIRERFKVNKIGVFGSYIKGEQKRSSDIDILVEFGDEADLFDLVGVASFLEKRLRQKVDVVPKDALRKELKKSILKEVAYV